MEHLICKNSVAFLLLHVEFGLVVLVVQRFARRLGLEVLSSSRQSRPSRTFGLVVLSGWMTLFSVIFNAGLVVLSNWMTLFSV